MKKDLSGYHFAKDDDVMNAVDLFLREHNDTFYTEGIPLLHDRWTKYDNAPTTLLLYSKKTEAITLPTDIPVLVSLGGKEH